MGGCFSQTEELEEDLGKITNFQLNKTYNKILDVSLKLDYLIRYQAEMDRELYTIKEDKSDKILYR
jgi:hypothetical protein